MSEWLKESVLKTEVFFLNTGGHPSLAFSIEKSEANPLDCIDEMVHS